MPQLVAPNALNMPTMVVRSSIMISKADIILITATKIIKTKTQYNQYCNQLEELLLNNSKSKNAQDEIELLTLLIEKWDAEHNSFTKLNPVELLHSLMSEKNMKPKACIHAGINMHSHIMLDDKRNQVKIQLIFKKQAMYVRVL